MNIPTLSGTIRRRILVNFRADSAVIQSKLPPPFRPKRHQNHAIVGICLIRLENIKPTAFFMPLGLSSESAAHRIAVVWDDENGTTQEGVFIPRRDTGSLVNHLVGGRLFPGQHHLASFHVDAHTNAAAETTIDFQMQSQDGSVQIKLKGATRPQLPAASCFTSLAEASAFFEGGSVGYSVRSDSDHLDGLRLQTKTWQVEALEVSSVYSSYYGDETQFPKGSVVFDHALLMQNIEHEWHTVKEL